MATDTPTTNLTETLSSKADPHLHAIEQALKGIDVVTGTIINRSDEVKAGAQTIWAILEDVDSHVRDLRELVEARTE